MKPETRGRKPLPEAQRRGRVIGARFTPAEELALRAYCSAHGVSIAEMIRNSVVVQVSSTSPAPRTQPVSDQPSRFWS